MKQIIDLLPGVGLPSSHHQPGLPLDGKVGPHVRDRRAACLHSARVGRLAP